MINQPAQFDFLSHYRGNGLSPWIIQLKYKDGTPVDLSGSHIRMDLKRPMRSRPEWVFNSDGSGDGLFTIIDPINGKIQFPLIKSWGLPTATYQYDLFICDADNFARAYLRGQWKVNQNISQVPCSGVSGGFSVGMASSGGTGGGATESVVIDGQTYEVEVITIEVDYQERGADGHTPYIQDGNWWINGVDTGKPSTGEDGNSAFEVWDAENGGGNTLQDYFDYLRQPAIDASQIALDSAQNADNSASNANQATINANQATSDAQQAAQQADEATQNANTATNNAVQATTDAIDAIADAEQATINANNARGWTPTSEFEEYNGKQLKKLIGYQGGTGTEPALNVGDYFAIGGGFTSDKDLAIDFRGSRGLNGSVVTYSDKYPTLNDAYPEIKIGDLWIWEHNYKKETYTWSGFGWQLIYETEPEPYFITTWKTDNPGTTSDTTIRIPTSGGGYNYDVDWGDGSGWKLGYTGDAEYDYGIAGTYTIKIRGDFPTIVLFESGEEEKILSIEQWGKIQWNSFGGSFRSCINLTGDNITDVPDLSDVTNMRNMLYDASSFNSDLSGWDVSNVTSMWAMFSGASSFNSDLSGWDVSNVTSMRSMFNGASSFNSDLSGWDVSNVTSMRSMFNGASSFNSDLSGWDVSKVTDILLFLSGVTMSTENYSNTLIGWANNPNGLQPNLSFYGGNSKYNAQGAIARQKIIDDYGWTIVDGGPE